MKWGSISQISKYFRLLWSFIISMQAVIIHYLISFIIKWSFYPHSPLTLQCHLDCFLYNISTWSLAFFPPILSPLSIHRKALHMGKLTQCDDDSTNFKVPSDLSSMMRFAKLDQCSDTNELVQLLGDKKKELTDHTWVLNCWDQREW